MLFRREGKMGGVKTKNQNSIEISSMVSNTPNSKGELACSKKDSFHPKVRIYCGDSKISTGRPFPSALPFTAVSSEVPCFFLNTQIPPKCHPPRLH